MTQWTDYNFQVAGKNGTKAGAKQSGRNGAKLLVSLLHNLFISFMIPKSSGSFSCLCGFRLSVTK